jgi:predicted Rossmann-fold nucleotide-binding protein
MQLSSLAVFCGSKPGGDPLFLAHAKELGRMMAERNIKLVYGGGGKGIMGAVADAVMEGRGNVTGIIPEILLEWEAQHKGITELHVVTDMHVRKKMLTWNTLKIHSKKIFIVNSNGFYNHLIEHMQKMYKEDFLYEHPEDRIVFVNEPADIFA